MTLGHGKSWPSREDLESHKLYLSNPGSEPWECPVHGWHIRLPKRPSGGLPVRKPAKSTG